MSSSAKEKEKATKEQPSSIEGDKDNESIASNSQKLKTNFSENTSNQSTSNQSTSNQSPSNQSTSNQKSSLFSLFSTTFNRPSAGPGKPSSGTAEKLITSGPEKLPELLITPLDTNNLTSNLKNNLNFNETTSQRNGWILNPENQSASPNVSPERQLQSEGGGGGPSSSKSWNFPRFSSNPNLPTSATEQPKSALQRVTSPLFNWFSKSTARPEERDVVNPVLHLATIAMNAQEDEEYLSDQKAEKHCTIHNVLPSGNQMSNMQDFWNESRESGDSDDSFDSQEEAELKAKGRIQFSESTENVNERFLERQASEDTAKLIFGADDTREMSAEEKIQIVFGLSSREKYLKEYACWLVLSVLLKGYLYVTEKHLCFYSALPTVPGSVRKEGFLQKRSLKRPRTVYYTYWFVLKTDGLYIYPDNKQLFFPKSTIYLKNVVSIAPNPEKFSIKLKTTTKTYVLKTDTLTQMNEWIDVISAAVLNAKNAGNDVRVVLPFDAIADLRIVKTTFNTHSVRITAISDESFQAEEYYFSYFNDVEQAYTQLKSLWDESKERKRDINGSGGGSRLLHSQGNTSTSDVTKERPDSGRPPRIDLPITVTTGSGSPEKSSPIHSHHRKSNSFSSPPSGGFMDNTVSGTSLDFAVDSKEEQESSAGRRSSVDGERSKSAGTRNQAEKRLSWWSHRKTSSDGGGDILQSFTSGEDVVSDSKSELFKSFFAIPQSERLIQTFSASYMKVLPLLGKLYVSSNYICFKSFRVGFRVKAVISMNEILKLDFRKGYSPFYHALVITTKSQDEIVFDFHSSDSRQRCFLLVNSLIHEAASATSEHSTLNARPRSAILLEIDHKEGHSKSTFTEDEISMVRPLGSIKTPRPPTMHITCLTIGTRGDVQPYIALCKGLMEHGHKCRIATHDEYQEWIESFGIEFRSVKGNPAELMQLCVDYGVFTVGFIREGLKKFRGWVEELLDSCWTACEGTDLLIESPTAFGGIHVAEGRQIPYFSAFAFPWTKTRTYPHPFGVAERHMGGSYNYMTFVMIEQVLWKALVISVNPWRRRLNMEPLSISVEEPKTPFLYSFSPSVVPPPPDWQDWIHLCGYWFLDNPELNWSPPDSLTEWLAAGPKPVYIGFGSIIVQNPDEMTRIVVEAVVKSGVRAILSRGWSSRSKSGPGADIQYPDCIYPLKSVPHDWLFPKLAGVVHHGGAGTTAAGLRAGCPTIIHPFFGDQFFWAERITDLGVGMCVRKLTSDGLAAALSQITSDTKMQEKAHFLGEKIRSENGVENAIEYIYRDLEYARKRIKQIAIAHKKHQVVL